jgi:glucose-6-phosphate 1-epimerase
MATTDWTAPGWTTPDWTAPGCAPQTVNGPDGAELTACAHGGHLIGWTPAGGRPRLWLSPTAECGPGLAIRGGIPVIFPQFAGRGPLPKHGVARSWQVGNGPLPDEVAPDVPQGATWYARLTADDETLAIWPHRFELTLLAEAIGNQLSTTLTVRNTSDAAWSFTAALHSYLALGSPEARLHGLNGRTAENNADDGKPVTLADDAAGLLATQGRDVAVLAADGPLVLNDPVLGRLEITAEGFPDRVMWNPGPGHGLGDVPDGAERDFVCVEPALLSPIVLPPATAWSGTQILRATP